MSAPLWFLAGMMAGSLATVAMLAIFSINKDEEER